jgi:transcriptional regulator of acetoin/glycerol metabolism
MRKEITPDERILMIEDMIERGEVYSGYRANKYPSSLRKSQKTHAHYKPRTVVDCSKEKFMSVYSPQKSWDAMAEQLGISRQTCIRLADKFGIDAGAKERGGRKVSDAQMIEALKQYPEKGLTAIAKELNICRGTLRYRAKKMGLLF